LLQLSAHLIVSEDKMSLADLYSALADPTRLRVLELLHDKARPVHELAGAFDISRPAISRHLRVLKAAGLVKEVKQGRENLYSFHRDPLTPGFAWLEKHQGRAPANAKAIEKPKATARLVAVPKVAAKPTPLSIAPPPPKQAPQLSFFDL
jgi:DNA-binding transcriptional ArsR family regulator